MARGPATVASWVRSTALHSVVRERVSEQRALCGVSSLLLTVALTLALALQGQWLPPFPRMELRNYLEQLGLEQYYDSMREYGVDSIRDVLALGASLV